MIRSVCDFLEHSAQKFPDKTAFVCGDKSITFKELDEYSSTLACEILKRLDNQNKKPILITLDKSINTIIAIYAVAKSGNFFTTIDNKNPAHRIEKIKEILEPKLIIKQDNFNDFGIPSINESRFLDFQTNKDILKITKAKMLDTDLLYVLFTSGSTGVPKGVCTDHRSICEYMGVVRDYFGFDDTDILANHSNFYFVKATLEIFGSVLFGATVHILDGYTAFFGYDTFEYYEKHKITTLNLVPSVINFVAKSKILNDFKLPNLKRVLIGGEMPNAKMIRIWQENIKQAEFYNCFGPTEATSNPAFCKIDRNREYDLIPAGKRDNCELFLLSDENKMITEPFKNAEICMRGTALARGYYNDKEQSAKVFIQNPLNPHYREIIYKSGDMGYYNELGELICVGRADNQIKIAGNRVELGDIESAVLSLDEVKSCACIYTANRVVCYCCGDINEKALRQKLKNEIPKYMIPNEFIVLEKLPLNANGKIDRKLLKESYENSKADI